MARPEGHTLISSIPNRGHPTEDPRIDPPCGKQLMEQIAQAVTSPTHYSHQWHLDEAKAQPHEQPYLRRPDTRVVLHHPRR